MINYADYLFYINVYKGSLSNDLFSSYIVKASREIDKNVNRDLTQTVIDGLSEIDQYRLKYETCEMVDYLYNGGSNANSISIDGVSISKNSDIKEKSNIIEGLPNELTRYI